MEQESDVCMQNIHDKKSKYIHPEGTESSGTAPDQSDINIFASPTPEKRIQPSRSTKKGILLQFGEVKQDEGNTDGSEGVELPDKYKMLAEFFDRIGTSVRLLKLRNKLPSFQNICTMVEVLTKRNLSCTHLAQMKYIYPEAIQIEKILVHDEKTLCMKPDMKVTLLLDAVEEHPEQSAFDVLHQVFYRRLLTFFNNHPECSNIPEATLPVITSEGSHTYSQEPLPTGLCIDSNTSSNELEPLSNLSHLSPSFSRHFSRKDIVPETEKTHLLASPVPLLSINSGGKTNQAKSSQEEETSFTASKTSSSNSQADVRFSPQCSIKSHPCDSSSMSLLNPDQLSTPVQQAPPRRSVPSSDEKIITETRISSHTTAKKSLDFLSPIKGDGSVSSSFSGECRDTSFKTAETRRMLVVDEVTPSSSALYQLGAENNDHKMSQTVPVKRQQMLASLLELLNMIHCIFQSANRSTVTKQELLHKIISQNLEIVETREVEEQLDLLEELVPDWICRKLVPSGDLLYSIKKVSDLESIRARLVDSL